MTHRELISYLPVEFQKYAIRGYWRARMARRVRRWALELGAL